MVLLKQQETAVPNCPSLKGKILNVKKPPWKILLNNEIKSMIATFGCGMGMILIYQN